MKINSQIDRLKITTNKIFKTLKKTTGCEGLDYFIKKDKFYIFNEQGKLNKKELQVFLERIETKKIGGLTGLQRGEHIFKVIKPEKDYKNNLITHISYHSFSSNFFFKKTEKNNFQKIQNDFFKKPYFYLNIFRIFDCDTLNLFCHVLDLKNYVHIHAFSDKILKNTMKKLEQVEKNENTKFVNDKNKDKISSKIIFETVFREPYISKKIEQCIIFTGVFFSNNIIINIPLNEIFSTDSWLVYEEIIKVFFVYHKGIITKALDLADEKTIFIALHCFPLKNFSNKKINHDFTAEKIFRFLQKMLDTFSRFDSVDQKATSSWLEESIKFKVFHIPFKKNCFQYLKGTMGLAEEITFSPQKIAFWENQAYYNKYRDIKTRDGFVNYLGTEDVIDMFEKFEKWVTTSTKKIFLSKHTSIDLISETVCRKIYVTATRFLKKIFISWKQLVQDTYVLNLGREYDSLFKKAEEFFFTEGDFFRQTEAFRRKFEILKECFYIECRVTWNRQIEHVIEFLKKSLKEHLFTITLDDRFERNSNHLVKSLDNEFIFFVGSTIPKFNKGCWKYSYHRENFLRITREYVELKMKSGYIKGELIISRRQPISIWFHGLLPHPFGKDSRTDSFTLEDNFSYEEKKERQQSRIKLMRYIIQKPTSYMNSSSQKKKRVNKMKKEDFIFKEKPKKAIERSSNH